MERQFVDVLLLPDVVGFLLIFEAHQKFSSGNGIGMLISQNFPSGGQALAQHPKTAGLIADIEKGAPKIPHRP